MARATQMIDSAGESPEFVGRREALKRIGVAAAVVAALPAVAMAVPVPTLPVLSLLPEPLKPRKPVNPRNDNGAPAYQDANNAAKIGVAGGISTGASVAGAIVAGLAAGEIINPVLGGVIGGLLGAVAGLAGMLISLFWPDSSLPRLTAADVWNMIKDRVAHLIDEKLQSAFAAYNKGTLEGLIAGLGCEVKKYHAQKSSGDPGYVDTFNDIENWCNFNMPRFQSAGDPSDKNSYIEGWHLLPQFVQVVNVYIMLALDVITPLKPKQGAPVVPTDPVFASRRLVALANFVGSSIAYVEPTLKQAYDVFDRRYQDSRSASHSIGYTFPWNSGMRDSSPGSYTADGVWQAMRDRNDNRNQYVTLVDDYLQWWRKLRDFLNQDAFAKWHANPSQPLAPGVVSPLVPAILDRELWYGPYGQANLADLGYQGRIFSEQIIPSPAPDVPQPPVTDAGILADFTYSHAWKSRVDVNEYNSDPGDPNEQEPPPSDNRLVTNNLLWHPISNLQLSTIPVDKADKNAGITKITIAYRNFDTGTVGILPATQQRAVGQTVVGIGYVRENGATKAAVDPPIPLHYDDTGYLIEEESFVSTGIYEIAAPEGHLLCNLWPSSHVSSVAPLLDSMPARNAYWMPTFWPVEPRNPPAIGSMMCSFRLKEPTLVPPVKIIAQLYVTSGLALTVREVAEAGRAWHRAMGNELSDAEAEAMADEIARLVASDRLDEQRQAFSSTPVVCTA